MILGHFGLALAAKRFAPRTSLGTTVLAAQLVDTLWPVALLLGVERVRLQPGLLAASPLDFVHYPWTHSLLMGIVWGLLLGTLHFAIRRDGRAALVVGALVPSHFLLDVLVHRPDLPLWPGGPLVGLGGWRSVPLTLALEALFFGVGVLVYTQSTTPRRGRLLGFVAFLVVFYLAAIFGPPPPSEQMVAWGALVLWLVPLYAAWVDRARPTDGAR